MYKNILATVNEFTNSEIASHYAIAMAKACEAKLALIFVSEEKLSSKDVFKHAESSWTKNMGNSFTFWSSTSYCRRDKKDYRK